MTHRCASCGGSGDAWPILVDGEIRPNGCYRCFLHDRERKELHISPKFKLNERDGIHVRTLLPLCKTPKALDYFKTIHNELTHYAYWFLLGTLWVDYNGWTELEDWKRLFASIRPKRRLCLMKPFEIVAYDALPAEVVLYRAHRENEKDWIAYSLDFDVARRFAWQRGVFSVHKYSVKKSDILCLFLRRAEREALVLDRTKPQLIEELPA